MITKRTYRRKLNKDELAVEEWVKRERESMDKSKERRNALLQDRQTTHGKFRDNAAVSQRIKKLMHGAEGWMGLIFIQQEALEMIATKLSRILTGDPFEKDHWVDIAGYAELIVKALNEPPPPISASDRSV